MKTIAGCILRNQAGEYLLVQERQERVRGLWNIPAGYADEGETARQAAERETREEVGLIVNAAPEPIHTHKDLAKDKLYCAFKAEIIGGALEPDSKELLGAAWLPFDVIKEYYENSLIRDAWIFKALETIEHENSRN